MSWRNVPRAGKTCDEDGVVSTCNRNERANGLHGRDTARVGWGSNLVPLQPVYPGVKGGRGGFEASGFCLRSVPIAQGPKYSSNPL